MQNKRRIIGIAAAVLLALVGTISLVAYVNSAKDQAVADETLVDVYVVDDFIPKGATADTIEASVSIVQIPVAAQAVRCHHRARRHRRRRGRDRTCNPAINSSRPASQPRTRSSRR